MFFSSKLGHACRHVGTVLIVLCLPILGFSQKQSPVSLGDPPMKVGWQDNQTFQAVNPNASALRLPASCNRQAIITDYNTNFIGSAVTTAELAWTGSVAGCNAGTISSLAQTRTLQRLNYYRRLVGLPDNVTYDPSRDVATQEASLMMLANNALDHTPPMSWTCYTAAGDLGAQSSNLASGLHSSQAIKGYIDDGGTGNEPTGHRRWILYSRLGSVGHGSTTSTDALWVFNPFLPAPSGLPPFIAFPTDGYMPRAIMPPRWSFGIPNADFASATVQVTDENNVPYAITQHPVSSNSYGDNTLTWEMPSGALTFSGMLDKVFKVTVSGVVIGGVTQPPYTYNVVAIDTNMPVTAITSSNPTACVGTSLNNGSATVAFDHGAKSYLWSNNATTASISNLAPGTYTVTITDKNDCETIESVTLTESPNVNVPTLAAAPTMSCLSGQSVVLTAGNCNGTINWSNGLGTGTTKTVNPTTTITYSVTCMEGACTSTAVPVTVGVLPNANCTPTASNGLSPYYGVEQFTFNTINSTSSSSQNDGANYMNRTCTHSTTVQAGSTHNITVDGYFTNSHVLRVYIDYNNDGDFVDVGEQVLNQTSNASVTVPIVIGTPTVYNVPLRVRVLADPSSASTSCNAAGSAGFGSGQLEDFMVIITPAPNACPAVTNITGNATICSGAGLASAPTFLSWQSAVTTDAANAAAIANPIISGGIIYSTTASATTANPPVALTPTFGTHSTNSTACTSETQTAYAYALCMGANGAVGGGDDSYLLLGTMTVTVNPTVRAGTVGSPSGCTITVTKACASDVMAASAPTGGAVIANFNATTGVYTATAGATAGTLTITFSNASACGTPTLVINTPACPASCPTATTVTNGAATVCSGAGTGTLAAWQTSVAAANPTGLVYSSVTPVAGTTAPNNTLPTGSIPAGCAAATQVVMAYVYCDVDASGTVNAGDTYTLVSTYTLTVNPSVQAGTVDAPNGCAVTVTKACAADAMAATVPTGGAVIANFNATTGVYTASAGAAAGTLTITFSNASACGTPTLVINTPACPASCPTATTVTNGAATVCSGAGTGTLAAWQTSVAAVNPTGLVYSSVTPVAGTTAPNNTLPTGSIPAGCSAATQVVMAYVYCDVDASGTVNAGDTYTLVSTYTLTVNPSVQVGTVGAPNGCAITVTKACASDAMAATVPTGGAVIANFNATTGVYTASAGAAAGTLTITFSNASACGTPTLVINTPACPAACPTATTVTNGSATVCSGAGTGTLAAWQTSVAAANPTGLVYSSVTPVAGTTAPNNTLPTGSIPAGCAAATQVVMAYVYCDVDASGAVNAGDTYTLVSTYTLTVNPSVQAGTVGAPNGCAVTVTKACAADAMAATVPTGGAVITNFNATTGVYTASAGAAAGTLTITFSNASACGTPTLVINTPACPASCPTLSIAPPAIIYNNSSCGAGCTNVAGSLSLPANPCPAGSTYQYSYNSNFSTVLTALPVYGNAPITLYSRCACEANPAVVSPSSQMTTNPVSCVIPTAPTAPANQTFCITPLPTIISLVATGSNIKWYATATGGSALANNTPLVNGSTYYASQTNASGCESSLRKAVTVSLTSSCFGTTRGSISSIGLPAGFAPTDPCSCNNNSDPVLQNNGTFNEFIQVFGPSGAVITGTATGGTPSALTFTEVNLGGGNSVYTSNIFTHVDGIGYVVNNLTAQIGSNAPVSIAPIGNKCIYPNVTIDPKGPFTNCAGQTNVPLTATLNPAMPGTYTWSGLGVTGSNFNPSGLPVGNQTTTLSFDGAFVSNVSPDNGITAANPGCIQVAQTSNIYIANCGALDGITITKTAGTIHYDLCTNPDELVSEVTIKMTNTSGQVLTNVSLNEIIATNSVPAGAYLGLATYPAGINTNATVAPQFNYAWNGTTNTSLFTNNSGVLDIGQYIEVTLALKFASNFMNTFACLPNTAVGGGTANIVGVLTEVYGVNASCTEVGTCGYPTINTAPANLTVNTCSSYATEIQNWLTANAGAVINHGSCRTVEIICNDYCEPHAWQYSDNCSQNATLPVKFTVKYTDGSIFEFCSTIYREDAQEVSFLTLPQDLELSCLGTSQAAQVQAWLNNNGDAVAKLCGGYIFHSNNYTGAMPNGCASSNSIPVTFTLTNECGLSTSAVASIRLLDNTAPTFTTVPASVTVACNAATPAFGTAVATDACTGVTVTFSDATTGTTCTGIIKTRTFTATDGCGNTATATQQITNAADNTAPSFTSVPASITVGCDAPATALGNAIATDACSTVTMTFSDGNSGTSCTGLITTRIFTATDACGNAATASQQITKAADTAAPTFTSVPANTTVNCGGTLTLGDAIATDACSAVTVTSADNNSGDACSGQIIRTWTATDACGNTATASATATRTPDTDAPVFTFLPEDTEIECGEPAVHGTPVAQDNCGTPTITFIDTETGNTCEGIMFVRTWTATDACGNTATAKHVAWQLNDNENPTIVSAPEDTEIVCGDPVVYGNAVFSDACGAVNVTHDDTVMGDACAGIMFIRTWTATDGCGNSRTAKQVVWQIGDTTDPEYVNMIEDEAVYFCGETPDYAGVSAVDNCGGAVTVTYQIDYDYEDTCHDGYGYYSKVRYKAVDACGNENNETITSHFVPTGSRMAFMNKPTDKTVSCSEAYTFDAVHPKVVSYDGAISTVTFEDVTNLTTCGSGTVTRRWTATDVVGNQAIAEQTVTILSDTELPTIVLSSNSVVVNCASEITVEQPLVSDNCASTNEITITYNDEVVESTVIRTWAAQDVCGNVANTTQIFVILDTQAPVFITAVQNKTVSCDAPVVFDEVTALDACSAVTMSHSDTQTPIACGVEHTRTWKAVDGLGHESYLAQTITMVDNTAPVFSFVPANESVATLAEVNFGTPQASDNCQNVTLFYTDEQSMPTCGNTGYTITRTWVADDGCNNEAIASQQISVAVDTQLPVFTTTLEDKVVDCSGSMLFDSPTATDNSGSFELTYQDVQGTPSCGNSGYTMTRVFTATDACNNVAYMSQTITITEDTEAPEFIGSVFDLELTHAAFNAWVPIPMAAADNCQSVEVVVSTPIQIDNCNFKVNYTATDACGNFVIRTQNIKIVDCLILGTNEGVLSSVSIYPNPVATELNIVLPAEVNLKNITAQVFDMLGKQVMMTQVVHNQSNINVYNLVAGTYTLRLTTDGGVKTVKFVKQ